MKEALKKSFEVLLKNGEYAEAEKLLIPYMKENPEDWDAKLLYGTCRMMQGDTETAKLVHQQAKGYFETGKDIPEEQKSFWDKYKKIIFYGAIGTALVLVGGAYLGNYLGKQMQDVFEVLSSPDVLGSPSMGKYAGPQKLSLERVDQLMDQLIKYNPPGQHKYAGPMRPEMERHPENAAW